MTLTLAGRPALSTPGARLACIVSPLRDAAHAETEARIIVAQHEHNGWLQELRAPNAEAATLALAEALAAFVAGE